MSSFLLQKTIAILLGTIVTYFIGSFWYSDLLFGQIWMRAARINMKDVPTDLTNSLLLEGLSRFIRCIAFMILCQSFGSDDFQMIFQLVMLITAGFVAPHILSRLAWEQKTWDYFLIQVSEQCVCLLVLGGLNFYILNL